MSRSAPATTPLLVGALCLAAAAIRQAQTASALESPQPDEGTLDVAEELRRPEVRLLAVEFCGAADPDCAAAAPRWRARVEGASARDAPAYFKCFLPSSAMSINNDEITQEIGEFAKDFGALVSTATSEFDEKAGAKVQVVSSQLEGAVSLISNFVTNVEGIVRGHGDSPDDLYITLSDQPISATVKHHDGLVFWDRDSHSDDDVLFELVNQKEYRTDVTSVGSNKTTHVALDANRDPIVGSADLNIPGVGPDLQRERRRGLPRHLDDVSHRVDLKSTGSGLEQSPGGPEAQQRPG